MAILSVSVPDRLRKEMNQLDEINWSAVARKAFEQKVEEVQFLKELVSKSKLTQKDADELAKKINSAVSQRYLELK